MKKIFIFPFLFVLVFGFLGFNINRIEARSGCCSHHLGVQSSGCGCNDGTPLSDTCAPYYSCTATIYKPPITTTVVKPISVVISETKPEPVVKSIITTTPKLESVINTNTDLESKMVVQPIENKITSDVVKVEQTEKITPQITPEPVKKVKWYARLFKFLFE
jgi:hypothetical protein